MSNKKTLDKIEKGIGIGVYKIVRLLKKDGDKKQVVYTWNKPGQKEAFEKLEFIKYKISELDPGKYEIEAGQSHTAGIKEGFPIEITEKKNISFTHTHDELKKIKNSSNPEETITPETMPTEIDFDDYINLIKENEALKAKVSVLLTELEMERNKQPLSDPQGSGVMGVVGEHLPLALNILDKYLGQRDRQIGIRERELSLEENGRSGKGKKKIKKLRSAMSEEEVTKEQILEKFRALQSSDPENFDAELDALEQSDPELYDYVGGELGIFEEEEGSDD